MKLFVSTLIVAIVLVTIVHCKPQQYSTKYDNVDLDEILKSDRLFNSYYKCLTNSGRCSPDGSELKRLLPDALKTNCTKCSENQRAGTDKVIRYLIEKRKAQWKVLQKLYDPDNIYINKYKNDAGQRGINLE